MNVHQFKSMAPVVVRGVLEAIGGDCLNVSFGEFFTDEKEYKDGMSGSVSVVFSFGNIERKHQIPVGWNDLDGLGFEDTEGEISRITLVGILKYMYFDLAMVGLGDEFLV
jgi:hypothetical protein